MFVILGSCLVRGNHPKAGEASSLKITNHHQICPAVNMSIELTMGGNMKLRVSFAFFVFILTGCAFFSSEQTLTTGEKFVLTTDCKNVSVVNPGGTYCAMLGYEPGTQETEEGQVTICTFPNGTICDSWDFLAGECGKDFSYCALQGYKTQTITEDGDPYLQTYAICIDESGEKIGTVTELSGLHTLIDSCNQ